MMQRVLTVARRELRGYFDQATAYVLIVAFLGITLFLAFRTMYGASIASLRPIFDLLPILFAVFVPAATMRSLAEERRGKTLEWLVSQPLTETEIVLGKFLGDWAFVLIALLGTAPTAIGVLLVSDADGGLMLAQYVGGALLAAQFVALGLWASSVTRNQITAFIIASVSCFLLFLIGSPVVQIGLPPALAGMVARLSVITHFENVARGVIDLRDVLYFVSTTGLFIALALMAVGSERLSPARPERARLRTGTGVIVALVIVVNLLGSFVRGRVDLTADELYTLSEGTEQILAELDDLVQVKLFASAALPPEIQLQLRDVRDLLADMRRASNGNLLVTDVDPDEDEEAASEAAELGIFPVEFNVLRDDEFEVRQGYYGLALVYADESEVTPIIQRTDDLEFQLVSQIYRMTTDERPRVGFVEGFGAKSPAELFGLTETLGDRYEIETFDFAADSVAEIDPDSVRVLVVGGPTQPLDSASVERVTDFVEGGGATLLLAEPVILSPQSPMPIPASSGLEPFLEEKGITLSSGLVMDLASSERVNAGRQGIFQVIAPYPLWPITRPSGDHATTNGLNSLTLSWGAGLILEERAGLTPLWETTESGAFHAAGGMIIPDQEWNVPESDLAPRAVAAAVLPEDGETSGRMIVIGDASFAEQQFVRANSGNLLFLANAIDWLAQEEALINIRSKDRTPPQLAFQSDASRNVLKWGNLVGVPLLFSIVGMARVTGRRRRAEAIWREVIG